MTEEREAIHRRAIEREREKPLERKRPGLCHPS